MSALQIFAQQWLSRNLLLHRSYHFFNSSNHGCPRFVWHLPPIFARPSCNQQFLDGLIGLTAIFSSFLFSPPKYARKVIYSSDCRRCPISGTKTGQVDIDWEAHWLPPRRPTMAATVTISTAKEAVRNCTINAKRTPTPVQISPG
jgi:hypothetical protein